MVGGIILLKEKIELNSNALWLRKQLGEDPSSPIDIFSLVNTLPNLTLVFYPMSERLSGMCVRTGIDRLIAINSSLSYGRQRFSAAHELYHLYFQTNLKSVVCGREIGGVKDNDEKNADAFASLFLAPYDALIDFIEKERAKKEESALTLEIIIRIEQHFGMSRQATLYRLLGEEYISSDFADTLKTNVIQSARKLGFDDRLYIPTPSDKQYLTTGSYIELVEKLKEKDVISRGKYEELLLDAYRSDIVYNLNVEVGEKVD